MDFNGEQDHVLGGIFKASQRLKRSVAESLEKIGPTEIIDSKTQSLQRNIHFGVKRYDKRLKRRKSAYRGKRTVSFDRKDKTSKSDREGGERVGRSALHAEVRPN